MDDSAYTPPSEPPRRFNVLQQLAGQYARHIGTAPIRVQRWISFMILCAVLERLRTPSGKPAFVIKGGVTLELRLGLRARATKDIDAVYQGQADNLLDSLDEALREPYENFTVARDGEPEDIGKAVRISIKLQYKGRAWGTVPLEISSVEGSEIDPESVPAISLADFGLDGPETIACLPLNLQIAQKIHAMTEPSGEGRRPNDRFRDAADLYVLRAMVTDMASLRVACEQVFDIRNAHPWPPAIIIPDHWPDEFARLAEELGLSERDIHVVAQELEEFIATIGKG
jgi:hypothetical protein